MKYLVSCLGEDGEASLGEALQFINQKGLPSIDRRYNEICDKAKLYEIPDSRAYFCSLSV